MESRIDLTIEKHNLGYNCAQAVLCTYCDLFDIDENTAFKISESFGLGMGGAQSTCGALSGLLMLLGLKNSVGIKEAGKSKPFTYKNAKEFSKKFEEIAGSTICKEIKGIESSKVLLSCEECIREAAKLVEKDLL